MTAREALIALLAAIALLGYWRWDAKRDGGRELILAQNAQHIATLDSSLKVERAKFRVDTVKTFKRITETVDVLVHSVRSDTLRLTDTVKVTVEVVREAVATLNACRETVLSCGLLRAREQQRGDSLATRVVLMERQRPSAFGNTLRAGLYLAAGFGVAKIVK